MADFSFLKGTFTGRLGDVVFSSWRGKRYAKVYTPPSNPDTPKQHAHREAWGKLGHIAKEIYEIILKPYTLPKPQGWTAFNEFIRINKKMMASPVFNPVELKIFDGSLPSSSFSGFTYDSTGKKVKFTWATTLVGIMKATDKAVCMVLQNDVLVGYGITTRDKGVFEINPSEFQKIKSGVLHGYLAFAQEPTPGTAEMGLTSATAYKTLTITGLREHDFDDIDVPASSPPPTS